jgi:hypothetical protein
MAKDWTDHERASPAQAVYENNLAGQWLLTGCAAEGAPYAFRALLHRLDDPDRSTFALDSPEVPKLAFLDKDCAGARGLSEAEIAKVKAIRDRAPSPAPKP